jgi:hypothetical protein
MRALVFAVALAGCATAPANPCSMATDHVAACTDEAPAFRTGACNEHRADSLLELDCTQLRHVAEAAKANGWWDDFLCELEFADHCTMTSRPELHTLVGAVHHLDDSPAVAVYVRVIQDGKPDSVRGTWTFDGGLFAFTDLEEQSYRLEVALAPTAATLMSRMVSGETYLELQAPIPQP